MKSPLYIFSFILFYAVLCPSLSEAQSLLNRKYEVDLSVHVDSYSLSGNPMYISERQPKDTDSGSGAFISLSLIRVLNENKPLQYRFGIGLARDVLSVYPLVALNTIGLSNLESIRVAEVADFGYQLHIPMSVSYRYSDPTLEGLGFKFLLGGLNKIRFYGTQDVSLVENFDFGENVGDFYDDQNLNDLALDYYSDFITPYSLYAFAGVGLCQEEVCGGIKLTKMLISPFKKGEGLKIREHTGFSIFLAVALPW